MITYYPPEQEVVNVGDRVDIGGCEHRLDELNGGKTMGNEYAGITQELRELMSYQALVGTDTFKSRVAADPDAFDAACDDIDAIHRSLEQENERLRDASKRGDDYDVGYKAGHAAGFDEGFASADDWCAQREDAMAEHGWMRGPIGADGKPMSKEHLVVDNGGNVGVIVETRFNDSNWSVLVDFGEGESVRFVWFLPKSLTHYHTPTVEDVLREFLEKSNSILIGGGDKERKLIAEYAAKLRLAGEDE